VLAGENGDEEEEEGGEEYIDAFRAVLLPWAEDMQRLESCPHPPVRSTSMHVRPPSSNVPYADSEFRTELQRAEESRKSESSLEFA